MGWNKIREQLCYNFGSIATKQYATSVLIDQKQNQVRHCKSMYKNLRPIP